MTLAVLCPGQGAQHPALFDFVDQFPESARVLAAAADALGDDPRGWLTQGDAIYRNATAQPLITIAQLAQWTALRTRVPEPAALAGYSVGELSCYGIGGALDADELPRLARERADAMDAAADANPGALIGVHGLTRAALQGLCEATASYIAIVIAIDTFVVGGSEAALTGVRAGCENAGAKITELRVGIASHTPLLAAAAEAFKRALEGSALSAPSIPIVAGVDAGLVSTRDRAIATLSMQISRTIEWAHCLDALHERGCRVFIELSPGHALCRMVRARFDDVEARSVDEFRELGNAAQWVAKKAADRP